MGNETQTGSQRDRLVLVYDVADLDLLPLIKLFNSLKQILQTFHDDKVCVFLLDSSANKSFEHSSTNETGSIRKSLKFKLSA